MPRSTAPASSLYDDDILLWSEQQAEMVRDLARSRRDLPNGFDAENVAEEIESVGRSELASVHSYLELILLHVIKLILEPDTLVARHWQREIYVFGKNLDRRFSPSMQGRIDLDDAWRSAVKIARLDVEPDGIFPILPQDCPFLLSDLLGGDLDGEVLALRLQSRVTEGR